MALFHVDLDKAGIHRSVAPRALAGEFKVEADSLDDALRLVAQRLQVPFIVLKSNNAITETNAATSRGFPSLEDAATGNDRVPGDFSTGTEAFDQPAPAGTPFGDQQNNAAQTDQGIAIGGEGEGFSTTAPTGTATPPNTPGQAATPDPVSETLNDADPATAVGTGGGGGATAGVARVNQFIQQALAGAFTPDELLEILNSPEFQSILSDPEIAALLGDTALQQLGLITQQAISAAGQVEVAGIESNPFGRSAEEDAALQALIARGGISEEDAVRIAEIAARAGITSPFALLATDQITIEDIQKLERIAASGGLSDESTIADIQRQLARGEIDNPFAFVSAGFDINDAERLVNAQQSAANAAVNAQLQGVQAQREGQFLDFIGNASGVGSAVGFGFDPQSFNPFGQQGGSGGQQQIPLDALTEAVGASPEGQVPLDFLRSQNTPGTQGLGSFRSTPANATEASVRDFSDEEISFTEGQLASQGITPSAADRRRRSFTPGTRQPTGANVSGF